MRIIRKEGTQQIEDWSADLDAAEYHGLRSMLYTVACYQMANRHYPYLKWCDGDCRVRVVINFETLEDATECFTALLNGSKSIEDYKAHVHDPRTLTWIM